MKKKNCLLLLSCSVLMVLAACSNSPGNVLSGTSNSDSAIEPLPSSSQSSAEVDVATKDASLNKEFSQAIVESFRLNFGGAGNPEWATSWYGHVTNIEVYESSDGNYVLVTIKEESPKEAIDWIGTCFYVNYVYRSEYSIGSVRVVTPDGETVFTRSVS